MGINLQTEPTFKTICTIGRDEANALVNIFDCLNSINGENGYRELEDIIDYRIDNLLGNIDRIKQELEKYLSKKKEEIFQARLDSMTEDRMRFSRALAVGD